MTLLFTLGNKKGLQKLKFHSVILNFQKKNTECNKLQSSIATNNSVYFIS